MSDNAAFPSVMATGPSDRGGLRLAVVRPAWEKQGFPHTGRVSALELARAGTGTWPNHRAKGVRRKKHQH